MFNISWTTSTKLELWKLFVSSNLLLHSNGPLHFYRSCLAALAVVFALGFGVVEELDVHDDHIDVSDHAFVQTSLS